MARNDLLELKVIGRLGGDAELRYTPSGRAVSNFNVATNREWTDDAGEEHKIVTWTRCALWGKAADAFTQYLTSGKLVYVSGRPAVSAYMGKEGDARASLELTVRDIQLLSGGSTNGQADTPDEDEDIPF